MKTIFITGGARGIGEATVRRAIGKYNVAFSYLSSEDRAKALEAELGKKGAIFGVKCDVSDPDSVKEAVAAVLKRFGEIDVAVLNAGISYPKMLCDMTSDDVKRTMDVNFYGVFNVTKEILPAMISRKSGKIIAISSMWGETGASLESDYSASKAAVIGFCKSIAKEVAPSNINVNVVSPGVIKTDMLKGYSKEELEALKEEIPLSRLGTPDDVADAVMCFADGLDYVTGEVLRVNGGFIC